MVNDIRDLYPSEVETRIGPGKGDYGYYRKPNGWIVFLPAWTSFRNDMEYKGFTFLKDYGVAPNDMPGNKSTRDVNGRLFSTVEEPFRMIFQNGGAHEFPISQIIAYRWHVKPPYRQAIFPQMEGVQVTDLFCPECDTGLFSAIEEQDAIEQLRQHLTSTTNTAHSYRPEDLRALGEEYGIDFFAPRRARMSLHRAEATEEPVMAPDMTGEELFRCNDCGAEGMSRSERMRHGKTCPAKSAVPA